MFKVMFTITICISMFTPYSFAQTDLEIRSLNGLPGVAIIVEDFADLHTGEVLSEAQVEKDVRALLEKAGIEVFKLDELKGVPGRPVLYVNINLLRNAECKQYAASVSLELRQDAITARTGQLIFATRTWHDEQLVILSVNELQVVRGYIGKAVLKFVGDFGKVNEK